MNDSSPQKKQNPDPLQQELESSNLWTAQEPPSQRLLEKNGQGPPNATN